MLYPFVTLADNTEIVHYDSYIEDGVEKVRVEIEKPIERKVRHHCLVLEEAV